jgi:hypothetical protein
MYPQSKSEEMEILRADADDLKASLETINKRIEALKTEETD